MLLYADSISQTIHNKYSVYQIEYNSTQKKIWYEKEGRLFLNRAGREEAPLTWK